MEIQIKDNKIYAPLKDKWLVLKPEEEVRQRYICRLVDSYGYDFKQMDQDRLKYMERRGSGFKKIISAYKEHEGYKEGIDPASQPHGTVSF